VGAAMGIGAALCHLRRSGTGQELRLSLWQPGPQLPPDKVMREPVHDATLLEPLLQELTEKRAAGARYDEMVAARRAQAPRIAAHRIYYCGYHTASGAIILGAVTRQNREATRAILGVKDETDDPEFDAATDENRARVDGWRREVQGRLLQRTAAHWVELFLAAGVPASSVNFPEEIADDPQVQALRMMTPMVHSITGPQRVVGPLIRMSETPTRASRPAPTLGGHTREVLLEAGLSDDEIQSLADAGIISRND